MPVLIPINHVKPSIVTTRRVVPNAHPIRDPGLARVALIGEAPGEDEENHHVPFVGRSGQFLTNLLRDVGIDRYQCLLGNVCQVRPPANKIETFNWDGPEIQDGLTKLSEDIRTYNPHICVLLGATPLRAARGTSTSITAWRGSLFVSTAVGSPFLGRKCLATLHPAFVLREFSGFPLLKFDLRRASDESKNPELTLPTRELITHYGYSELCYIMDEWPKGLRCSVDIEGGINGWPCVSVCGRPTKSITIAFGKFSETEHGKVLQSFARLMARRDVPKVLQNSLYDNFVLSYQFGIFIRNVVEDTMLKGWEVYCELPKGLATQTSIWTREPYYKADRKSDDLETFYQYCARDSAVTLEICNQQDNVLTGHRLAHYRMNMELLNPALYMELRGIKYDKVKADQRMSEAKAEIEPIGTALCEQAKTELRGPKGFLVPQRLMKALYQTFNFPTQTKKSFSDDGKTETETSDQEALLHLFRQCRNNPIQTKFILGVLAHKRIESRIKQLRITTDPDGRIRSAFNVVGTETGRFSSRKSPTGSGGNLQTEMPELRDLFIADDGHDMFQLDGSGADGWTVAAHTLRLGDPTMFEDYQAGLKPAKIIGWLYYLGADVNNLSRADLVFWTDRFDILAQLVGTWLYLGCKRVQHGSNYLMGIPTMQLNVMKDSYKQSTHPVFMEHSDGRALQQAYFLRYSGVARWHQWAESKLVADGRLVSASGQERIFFGRRFGSNIKDTVKEFLAHEPQSNTTYATSLGMLKLWNDPENRRPDGSLIIEPLNQIHDAMLGQWPTTHREWARNKVKSYFSNPITIAGTTLTIPFEGKFGRSWGELTEPI